MVRNKVTLFFTRQRMLSHIKRDICEKFGLNIVTIEPLQGGFQHLSYKCVTSDGNKIMLRVCQNIDEADIIIEAQLLDKLSLNPSLHNHISPMISARNGQKLCRVDNFLYCLFKYIENNGINVLTDSHIKSLGHLVRKLHEIGVHVHHDFVERQLLDIDEILSSLSHFYSENTITLDEYINLINITTAYIDAVKKYPHKTILHRDIHRSNLIINNANNVLVLIDFDDFCVGPEIIDLAIMLSLVCLERDMFDIEMAKKILHAYYSSSSIKITFNSHDFLIFMLFNLVRACEYYLQLTDASKRKYFNIAYHRIEELRACSENIIKELKVFNSEHHRSLIEEVSTN